MKKAFEGAYITNNSVYYIINKSGGGQGIFKNNELLYNDMSDIFDNCSGNIDVLINNDDCLSINDIVFSSKINKYYEIVSKNEFIKGLEVIGNKIFSKINNSEKIKNDIISLMSGNKIDYSLIAPTAELKENTGVFQYDKKSYGIAGCYLKAAEEYGCKDYLLKDKEFKSIIRNMAVNSNGIANEVKNEYLNSLNNNQNKKKSSL